MILSGGQLVYFMQMECEIKWKSEVKTDEKIHGVQSNVLKKYLLRELKSTCTKSANRQKGKQRELIDKFGNASSYLFFVAFAFKSLFKPVCELEASETSCQFNLF